jgi:hypothetical protein
MQASGAGQRGAGRLALAALRCQQRSGSAGQTVRWRLLPRSGASREPAAKRAAASGCLETQRKKANGRGAFARWHKHQRTLRQSSIQGAAADDTGYHAAPEEGDGIRGGETLRGKQKNSTPSSAVQHRSHKPHSPERKVHNGVATRRIQQARTVLDML